MMNKLRIGQINVAKSNVRQHVIFNSLSSFNFHIICVQECWMGEIRLPISFNTNDPPSFGTVSHPSWVSFHPPPVLSNQPEPILTFWIQYTPIPFQLVDFTSISKRH